MPPEDPQQLEPSKASSRAAPTGEAPALVVRRNARRVTARLSGLPELGREEPAPPEAPEPPPFSFDSARDFASLRSLGDAPDSADLDALLDEALGAEPPEARVPLTGGGGDGPRLLVVEDDPTIAYTLEYMLAREGFRVVVAQDGRTAKELIDTIELPSLVLLDILMPHIDGFHLIDHIRSKPFWSRVPIVMLTSNAQERDIVRALNAGANDYVTKPFQIKELIARLRRFCKLSA